MEPEEQAAFLQILKTNKDRIFRICRSYAADTESAKDLFQEVCIQFWKSQASFKNESTIDTWLYRIALNVCLRGKTLAERQKRNFVPLESIRYKSISEEHSTQDSEQLLSRMRHCIRQLEETDKSVILLHLEDLPYKEIASILGISENHVAVKIKRIKTKLFTCIKTSSC